MAGRDHHCPVAEPVYDTGAMNRSKFTVILLLVNLGLVLATAYFYKLAHAERPGENSVVLAAQAATPPAAVQGPRIVKTNIVEASHFHWSQLEADDYRTYIERLRSIGVPEQTIRDLVIADIDKLFAPRLHTLNPGAR